MMRSLVAFVLSVAAGASGAQTLSPAPLTGLWETETRMLLNGQDVGQMMRKAQEEMLKSMPADQRAQMAAMMRGQGGPMMGDKQKECVTAAEVARATDPKQALAEMHKEAPRCRFEPVKAAGSTMAFKGKCADPEGFTGDVSGEFTLVSDKSWTWRYIGKGRMPQAAEMPGLKVAPGGQVEMSMQGSSRWLAASCGNVKP